MLAVVPPEFAELRAKLVAACAGCENLLGRHGDAHDRLERALADLPDGNPVALAMLEAELAADALYDSDFEALAAAATRARASADAAGDPGLVAMSAALDCFARYGRGDIAGAEAARADAAAALDAMDDGQLAGRLEAPYFLGFAEYLCERYDDVIRHTERALAIARATGQGQFVVPMLVGLAHALESRGRVAEALDTVEAAVEAARLSGNRQVLSWALVGEGWIATMIGDLVRAERAAEEAVALLAELSDSILSFATHALAALVFLETGDPERCLAEAARAGAPDFDSIEPGRAAWVLAVMARAELERGDADAARAHAERARAVLADMPLPLMESTVAQAEALLALDAGDAAEAARIAASAARLADTVGAAGHAARMRALQGHALAAAGDRDGARAVLKQAESELAACGVDRLRAEAARDLRRLGVRVSARQRRGGGEGLESLSGREREIAELVALGRTNREIAGRAVREREDGRGPPAQRVRQARRLRPRGGRRGRRPLARRRRRLARLDVARQQLVVLAEAAGDAALQDRLQQPHRRRSGRPRRRSGHGCRPRRRPPGSSGRRRASRRRRCAWSAPDRARTR